MGRPSIIIIIIIIIAAAAADTQDLARVRRLVVAGPKLVVVLVRVGLVGREIGEERSNVVEPSAPSPVRA